MNLKNLTLISSIALGLIAVPTADAQRSGGGRTGARSAGAGMRPSMGGASRPQFAARSGGQFRGEQSHRWRNRGDGNWRNRDGGDRWRNRDGDRRRWGNNNHWRHRRYYPRYYGGFYGYPYGYGYGFGGYGYGYPYFGSSASLYYNGYHPQYTSNGYTRGGSVTAEVQQELARAGYYRGAIDGVIGNGTRSAIRAYERANGLRVDGRIDQELLSSMGIG